MLAKHILYYGSATPLPPQIPLRAGPLSLLYENGDLRMIKLGDTEILRRVYVAVRDQDWNTIAPVLTNIQMEISDDSFQIEYNVANKQGQTDFTWQGRIVGDAQGTISFTMNGVARATFWRNRIGFCVLHPIALAGVAARIEHVDGGRETAVFPVQIAPQLVVNGEIKPVIPFNEMRSVAHAVTPDLSATVHFSGDIFETEDQRNWTDASYKSYSTPLRLPFPVEIKQGTKISQAITLRLSGADSGPAAPKIAAPNQAAQLVSFQINLAADSLALPQIGLGVASHGQPLSQTELARLRALHLAHLRVDLKLAQLDYAAGLRQATVEANALHVALEIALHLTADAVTELNTLATLIQEIKPPVARWLIFHVAEKSTTAQWVDLARAALTPLAPAAKFGAGTNVYFTELNRSRPPVSALDLVAYSINPQVHAVDNYSLMETLAAQAATITSTRQFIGELPLAISPVTLQPRVNPNATGPEAAPNSGELPAQVDVRQMALFGAAWTLGSLKYIAETGSVASVTYYETSGWRGVLETAQGSPLPDKFPSLAGGVFPLYHVLADVGEFAGEVVPIQSSAPLRVDGLALRKAGKTCVLLANLSAEAQTVTVAGLGAHIRIRILDATNAEAAMRAPEAFRAQTGNLVAPVDGLLTLDLLPYAVARVESV